MSQRFFTYSDAKSDKFWNIALKECTHTVSFGRAGTVGQTQTKEFTTEEEARRSFEKLIREKLKKGYVEIEGQGCEAAEKPGNAEVGEAKESDSLLSTQDSRFNSQDSAPDTTDLPYPPVRSLNLNPEDWFLATWRNLAPLQRPEPQPFNFKEAQARLANVATSVQGWEWNWSKADISASLSREEAHFWLTAMMQADNQVKPKQLAEQLATQVFTGDVALETFQRSLLDPFGKHGIVAQLLSSEICLPLVNLFSIAQFIELFVFVEQQIASLPRHQGFRFQILQSHLVRGFQKYVLPYLTSAEIAELRQNVENQLDLRKWPTDYYETPSPEFHLAAHLGCSVLRTLVESWADDYYTQNTGWRQDYYHRPQEIIFGLESAELVQTHMRRLKLSLQFLEHRQVSATYLRAWLAHTELSALDTVSSTILDITNKKDAEALLKEFVSCVQAPEAAPVMLELMLLSKAPQVARQWLEENPAQTIAGLIAFIGKPRLAKAPLGQLTQAAIEFLRAMKRRGYEAYIQTCINHELTEVAEKIRETVLNVEEKTYIPFDQKTTPEWLQKALATLSIKTNKKTSWAILPADLPPIAVGDYRFNDLQLEAVLHALRQSKLESCHPLVVAVKAHADFPTLDAFAWKLFESWLTEGAPSKENWAMMAVGLLGSDISALKLAPLIRVWPGESQHQRAVLGLECLRSIGSDTALMQINGISQKVKFKGIKQRAQECIEAIAQERGMTREQLEDRIVPDCDLDEHGSCIFDFGARQFRFVLGADLKPMVKDADGKVKSDLPKLNTKDDKEKVGEAIANWKLLKKQVSEVIKIQSMRLEQAMIMGRRWQVDEFETLLVQHPLMTHLVQRLIWGAYDSDGKQTATFRVTEDQTYADANDTTFALTGMTQVGIVHPLHLSAELCSAWGEILSDYEIVSPFLQVGRALHYLEAGEAIQKEITRFKDAKVPAVTLVGMLEKSGWIRGIPQDAGVFHEHSKPFYGANVTAIVQYYGVPVGYMEGWDDQSIETCFFLKGIYTPEMYPNHQKAIALGEVDPVVMSEVLKDLIAIAAKAQ